MLGQAFPYVRILFNNVAICIDGIHYMSSVAIFAENT